METGVQSVIDYNALIEREAAAFFEAAARYLKPEDVQLLRQAFEVSREAHEGQTRKSGEPYITHPLAVATMLTDWRLDVQGLAAALLHDVLEDTGVTKPTLVEKFGKVVADLVDGLSKLERLEYQTKETAQAENFRKMVLAMARDIRVIIVKLADRLHNMRTLDSMREDKRQRIALETLEIYAPIANRIGQNKVYRELQDLAFKHLHPHRYSVLSKAVRAARGNRREVVNKILKTVSQRLVESNIEATIKGREKNLYSIYKKMQEKHLSFSEVLDIYGFRVVVNDIPSCYLALGALHSLYKPIPGKFKDYIAIPKGNGYQSLHTTLFGPYGTPVEMQIRTREMNGVAEAGVASHWMYKSGDAGINTAQQRTHQWLQSLLDMQEESDDAVEFLEHIKIDLFPDEVYVFTPKGKIMVLPQGSTPVDFAYAVHTDVGHRCIAARVNHVLMPLRTVLRNGDTVEVITSTQAKPNPSWLTFVQSGRARSGIRNYLKSLQREEASTLGEKLLKQAIGALAVSPLLLDDALKAEYMAVHGDKLQGFAEVLAEIGAGKLLPIAVARRLVELAGERLGEDVKVGPVTIRGNEGGTVQLSSCCNPLPGDEILGVITKGQGLVIHRVACPNVQRVDHDKLLNVNWETQRDRMFGVSVSVLARNERGALADIAAAISQASANIESVDTQDTHVGDGFIHIHFRLQVESVDHLSRVLNAVQSLVVVQRTERR
ncbi:guanosine-3',5'-bis(diphosphate) 3'-pyrophosphohydrolase [Aquitalea magnusonii]|jgi:guanosine-3',5'-bis(diphosphate) 3'-pyrophosphohydrolase|uniref:RelA/SpoT family protein n=1 Tax=unclassified Aquitalea TaxID=2628611 RepID=UPI0005F810EC|nr:MULTISPECIES: bifunctional (p)ppGpp synthetase/guanosine-3',5'-bis(diphosphate) 3'-pyrophosphohydrolase [unclassified Aquitalea]KJV32578.1 guanosine-3',5'-bis(diphosphate) 3'-pyrophosphohydrolase [Aquitalea magnusonii]QBJ77365.1 bifunctional (p)ppGpp synthetase/guanosine-3',5'-bis(diphosphate) 3'-pyrophosphohydrolase [Aquitalea sp. USM4]